MRPIFPRPPNSGSLTIWRNVGAGKYDLVTDATGNFAFDDTQEHRLVAGTKGDCVEAGRLMRRQAARIHLDQADEKIGNVDGSPWIRNEWVNPPHEPGPIFPQRGRDAVPVGDDFAIGKHRDKRLLRIAISSWYGVERKTRTGFILQVWGDPGTTQPDRRHWLRPHT